MGDESDEIALKTAAEVGDADPIVPPDLIPTLEQPAKANPAPLWKSVTVAVVAVLVVAGIGAGIWNAMWGRRAMMSTAIVAAEALVQGDAEGLAAVSTPEVARQLTPTMRADMKRGGALAVFSEPVWDGDRAEVKATVGPAQGRMVLAPDPKVGDAAAFTTSGSLGGAVGVVLLVRDVGGWRVRGLSVQPAK